MHRAGQVGGPVPAASRPAWSAAPRETSSGATAEGRSRPYARTRPGGREPRSARSRDDGRHPAATAPGPAAAAPSGSRPAAAPWTAWREQVAQHPGGGPTGRGPCVPPPALAPHRRTPPRPTASPARRARVSATPRRGRPDRPARQAGHSIRPGRSHPTQRLPRNRSRASSSTRPCQQQVSYDGNRRRGACGSADVGERRQSGRQVGHRALGPREVDHRASCHGVDLDEPSTGVDTSVRMRPRRVVVPPVEISPGAPSTETVRTCESPSCDVRSAPTPSSASARRCPGSARCPPLAPAAPAAG